MSEADKQSNDDSFRIRQCTIDDEEAAIAVCLQTGSSGNDATSKFNDPKILGYRYASPYIHLSPELAFVLKDLDGNVCGYVLATLDSTRFYQRYVNEWLPKMKQLYPIIPSVFDEYPSHLHIDLLPKAQGKGYGTKMIHHIESELKQRGSHGVHLGMAANNTRAFHFYTKLGFIVLAQEHDTLWLGKKLI